MARQIGPWGNYTGKIGNLVYYIRNGKQVVRKIGKMTKPATEAQLACRKQMAVVIDFLKPVTEFINAGFGLLAAGTDKTAYNFAVSYNRKNAVTGIYPDVVMDFEKVLVTQGRIEPVFAIGSLQDDGMYFGWSGSGDCVWPRSNDQVMLLIYFPELKTAVYELAGAKRAAGEHFMPLKESLMSEYMEVYLSFVSEDRKSIANSGYLGAYNKE